MATTHSVLTMNEHLKPVFNILLTTLENEELDYWVYGGVSIAALVGKFIRFNNDVDIFVKEDDFQKTKLILERICNKNGYLLINCPPLKKSQRPKIDIKIDRKEVMSVVPVYLNRENVEFRFWKGIETYSNEILGKVKRNVSGYRFYSPRNEYIKKLFINYLQARKDKKGNEKLMIDAKSILTGEEFARIYNSV